MGFKLKNVVKSVTSPAAAIGAAVGGGGGFVSGLGVNELMRKPGTVAAPGEDPMVSALRKKMTQEATDYRTDMSGLMEQEAQGLKRDAYSALDKGQRNVNQNFNSRGLLYSGLREGAQGDLRNQVSGQLARGLGESRANIERTARGKEESAAQVGMAGYQDALRRQEENMRIGTEASVARRQALQQLGKASGYAAGEYYGGGFEKKKTNPPGTSPID